MKSLLLSLVVLCLCAACSSLKCQTDDGVTEEDVRRIVRVCMRKIGDNTYDGNDYSDDNSDEYDDQDNDQERNNDRKHQRPEDEYRQRNRDHYRNFRNGDYNDNDGYSRNNGGGDRNRNQNSNSNNNNNNQDTSLTDKQTERDRACLVHCFFQEMKMVREAPLGHFQDVPMPSKFPLNLYPTRQTIVNCPTSTRSFRL